jgi:adenylylsulfate kinase
MLFVQFTGLSGSGKTTLAYQAQQQLQAAGYRVVVIDGDECRKQFWPELTYSERDREENIRRLGRLGRMFCQQGAIVLMAAINPFEHIRAELRQHNHPTKTVFVTCSMATLIARDTKGLYARALLQPDHPDKLTNLTGINAPYEPPISPDLTINTDDFSPIDCTDRLVQLILDFLNPSNTTISATQSTH